MKVLFVSLFVVIVDQITKLLVKGFSIPFIKLNLHGLQPGRSIPVLDGIFNITLVENPGIAFGIDFGSDFKLLISIFALAASAGLLFYIFKNKDKSLGFRLSLALILGGAVGNLIDRIFYGIFYDYAPLFHGKVVDFFDFRIFNLFIFNRTFGNYVFNFADVSVTVGVILLLFAFNHQKITGNNLDSNLEKFLAENKE
ncbi:MAG: signal peptidase II [Ignavibacteriaceae bacterium]